MATEGGKALLKWSEYDKDKVKKLSAELMKRSRATYDRIGSLPAADVNYENTLKASLNLAWNKIFIISYAAINACARPNMHSYNTQSFITVM